MMNGRIQTGTLVLEWLDWADVFREGMSGLGSVPAQETYDFLGNSKTLALPFIKLTGVWTSFFQLLGVYVPPLSFLMLYPDTVAPCLFSCPISLTYCPLVFCLHSSSPLPFPQPLFFGLSIFIHFLLFHVFCCLLLVAPPAHVLTH